MTHLTEQQDSSSPPKEEEVKEEGTEGSVYWRQLDIFNPDKNNATVTIVGCGGIGSWTAMALAKLGIKTFRLYDNDVVEAHNLPNQFFFIDSIAEPKTKAVGEAINSLSPQEDGLDITVCNSLFEKGDELQGIVVMAVDNMSTRRAIFETTENLPGVRFVVDARLAAQLVAVRCFNPHLKEERDEFEKSLYSDENAEEPSCTNRAVIDTALYCAALITTAVRKHLTTGKHEKIIQYDVFNTAIHRVGA